MLGTTAVLSGFRRLQYQSYQTSLENSSTLVKRSQYFVATSCNIVAQVANFRCINASRFCPSRIFNSNFMPGTSHAQRQKCCRPSSQTIATPEIVTTCCVKIRQESTCSNIGQHCVKGWTNDRNIFLQHCWAMLPQNFATVRPRLYTFVAAEFTLNRIF